MWDDGQTDSIAISLCAGSFYPVTVTDTNGCNAIDSVFISALPDFSISFSNTGASCDMCDGISVVTPSGGNAPYTYLWSDGQTDSTATGLCPGSYTVSVTNTEGCISAISVSISGANDIIKSLTVSNNVSCFGGTDGTAKLSIWPAAASPFLDIVWSNGDSINDFYDTTYFETGLSAGIYYVTVYDANGCTEQDSVVITQPSALGFNFSKTDANCGMNDGSAYVSVYGGTPPYTYFWSTWATTDSITDLVSGVYSLMVTDFNLCTHIGTVNINELGSPTIIVDSTVDIYCNGDNTGAVYVNISGGVTPYSYSWSNGDTIEDISNLPAGDYTLTVTGFNNCQSFNFVSITEPTSLNLIMIWGSASCYASGIITGGTSPYSYQWNDQFSQTEPTAVNLPDGTYILVVTDANGCTASDTITMVGSSCTVGIKNKKVDNTINIYPNPNTGQFTVKFDASQNTLFSLNIYRIDGKLVYSEEVNTNTGSYTGQFDLSKNAKGIYFIKLITNSDVVTKKVIHH